MKKKRRRMVHPGQRLRAMFDSLGDPSKGTGRKKNRHPEAFRRRYFMAKAKGDLRLLADGSAYRVVNRGKLGGGTWVRVPLLQATQEMRRAA